MYFGIHITIYMHLGHERFTLHKIDIALTRLYKTATFFFKYVIHANKNHVLKKLLFIARNFSIWIFLHLEFVI